MEKRVSRYVGGAHGKRIEYAPGKWSDAWFSPSITLGNDPHVVGKNITGFEDLPDWVKPERLNIRNYKISNINRIIAQNKIIKDSIATNGAASEFTEADIETFSLNWYELGSDNLRDYWNEEIHTHWRPYNPVPGGVTLPRKQHTFEMISDYIEHEAAKSADSNETFRVMLDPEPIEWILKTESAVEYLGEMHTYLRERFPDIEFCIYAAYPYVAEATEEPYDWSLVNRAIEAGFFHKDIVMTSVVYYYQDPLESWSSRRVFDSLMNYKNPDNVRQNYPWRAWWGREVANLAGCACELIGTGVVLNGPIRGVVRKEYLDMLWDMADQYGYDRVGLWGAGNSMTEPWVKYSFEAADYMEAKWEKWYDQEEWYG